MERLWELTKDYDPVDIWNKDETGCFFKALLDKGLAEKKQTRGGKKPKTRLTISFFISAAGEKVIVPIVIWRSVKPRCFKKLINPKRSYDVQLLLGCATSRHPIQRFTIQNINYAKHAFLHRDKS